MQVFLIFFLVPRRFYGNFFMFGMKHLHVALIPGIQVFRYSVKQDQLLVSEKNFYNIYNFNYIIIG